MGGRDLVFYAALVFWLVAQVGTWPRSLERESPKRIRIFASGHLFAAVLFAWWWYLGAAPFTLLGGTVPQLLFYFSEMMRARTLVLSKRGHGASSKDSPGMS